MAKVAKHSDAITDKKWQEVNSFNRKMVEEYLDNSTHLSPKSLKQYESALRIYFYWIKENKEDKKCVDIKARDYMMYQNSLYNRGMSESGIRFKRSAISAFNQYIMLYYEEEYPTFRNYVTQNIIVPKTGEVHKKEALTPSEYKMLCDELEKREEWQMLAYLNFSYSTGCRREEARLLLKEVINYKPIKKMVNVEDEDGNQTEMESVAYMTHDIRCKGRGSVGTVRKLMFSEKAMETMRKWIEVRGNDDCEYMFVTKTKAGKCNQVSESTFNYWCINTFSDIVGFRVTPHTLRRSRATNLVISDEKSIETARKLLGHASSDTTRIYVLNDEENEAFDAFV